MHSDHTKACGLSSYLELQIDIKLPLSTHPKIFSTPSTPNPRTMPNLTHTNCYKSSKALWVTPTWGKHETFLATSYTAVHSLISSILLSHGHLDWHY